MPDISNILSDAVNYARSVILKGGTQLENNALPLEKANALRQGLADSRAYKRDCTPYLYEKIFDSLDFGSEASKEVKGAVERLFKHEYEVKFIEKYNFGNCHELAVMAFDYIYQLKDPSIYNVEVCYIERGDHVFCVVNRDPTSDLGSPTEWGKDAYIVDPWSKLFYPASEYLQKLKCYYRKDDRNNINDYDPAINNIRLLVVSNLAYNKAFFDIITSFSKSLVLESQAIVWEEILEYISLLEKYKLEFDAVQNSRAKKDKYVDKIVKDKIDRIDEAINKINSLCRFSIDQTETFLDSSTSFRECLQHSISVLSDATAEFNRTLKFITTKPKREPDLLSKLSSMFGKNIQGNKQSDAERHVDTVMNHIGEHIRRTYSKS